MSSARFGTSVPTIYATAPRATASSKSDTKFGALSVTSSAAGAVSVVFPATKIFDSSVVTTSVTASGDYAFGVITSIAGATVTATTFGAASAAAPAAAASLTAIVRASFY